ncbi:MAG: SprT family zinc-dependent metalloprotease [Candidatus Wallbacteria bacterium]|nr:SprT family zinc-dependent metalloprotease [Candidatus Wallbacteria bacterium]
MKQKIEFIGNFPVICAELRTTFSLFRSSRRFSIGITINPEKGLSVTAPFCTSHEMILNVLKKKSTWIIKKIEDLACHKVANRETLQPGCRLKYLGREYVYSIEKIPENKLSRCKLSGKYLTVYLPRNLKPELTGETARDLLQKWYLNKAENCLQERCAFFSSVLKQYPSRIIIKEQKRRWGSCNAKGEIRFNWRIIMGSPELVDYIVVHELCHLKYRNHGKRFWQEVGKFLPDYLSRRKNLSTQGLGFQLSLE